MVAPVCEQNVTGRVVYFPERMKQLIFKNGIVEEGKVYEIDNNLIDRQGYRNAEGVMTLAKIFHPEAFQQ